MLKNILNLKGAQELSKNEQQSISGGIGGGKCYNNANCCAQRDGSYCDLSGGGTIGNCENSPFHHCD